MKKRLLATLLALCLIVGLFPTMALAAEFFQADWTYPETGEAAISFTLGSGTQEEPFIIESAQDLANLAYLVNTAATYEDGSKTYASASYQLASNIDLQGAQWHPIGIGGSASEYEAHSFCGTFDGNYHTVSGLLISEDTYAGITNQNTQNNTDVKVLGLFGVLSDGAVIENLTVQTSAINLSDSENMCFAGMIAGAAVTSTGEISIKNCTVSSDCSVVGNSVDGAIAGIVGMIGGYSLSDQTSGTILVDGNKNYATIDGGEGKAGGITALVRWSDSNGVMTVSNNENYGSIDGNASGGIVGFVNVECGLEMNQGNQNFGSVSGGYCSGSLGGRVLSLKLTDYTVSPDSLLEDFGLVAGEIGETVIWQNDSADTTYYFSGLDGAMLRFSSVPQGQIVFTHYMSVHYIGQTTDGTLRIAFENTPGNLEIGCADESMHTYEITNNGSINIVNAAGKITAINHGEGWNALRIKGEIEGVMDENASSPIKNVTIVSGNTRLIGDLLFNGELLGALAADSILTVQSGATLSVPEGCTVNAKVVGTPADPTHYYGPWITLEGTGKAIDYREPSDMLPFTNSKDDISTMALKVNGEDYCRVFALTNAEVELPTLSEDGYIFSGWFSEENCTGIPVGTVNTSNTTYYATWTECQHAYGYTYTGNENTLTQACSSCGHIFGTVTLEAPANLVYDGSVKEASVTKSGNWQGDVPAVEYYSNSVKLESAPVSTGAYTAQVMAEGVTVSVSFTISNPPYIPVTPPTPTKPAEPDEPDTPVIPGALPFVDVRVGDWYYEDVAYVYAQGIMTGSTASTFAPNDAMTRAMVWTVLGRMSGASVEGGMPWYALAQSWAVAGGVSDGTGPNDSITREQLVTMLYRQAGSPEVGVSELALLGQFTDGESVSSWAEEAMAWAVSQEILTGDGDLLRPQATATRAQVAAILARYCEANKK